MRTYNGVKLYKQNELSKQADSYAFDDFLENGDVYAVWQDYCKRHNLEFNGAGGLEFPDDEDFNGTSADEDTNNGEYYPIPKYND